MTKSELLECFNSFSWYGKPTTDKKFNRYKMIIFLSDKMGYRINNPHSIIHTLPKIDSTLIEEYGIIDCNIMIKGSSLALSCNDVELSTIHSIVSDYIEFCRNDKYLREPCSDLCNFYEARIKQEKEFISNIEKGESEQKISSINTTIRSNDIYIDENSKKIETVNSDPDKHPSIYDRFKKDLTKCKHIKYSSTSTMYLLSLLYDVIDYCSDMIDSLSRETIAKDVKFRRVYLTNICDLPHFIGKSVDIVLEVVKNKNSTIDEEKTIHPVQIDVWSKNRLVISRRYNRDEDGFYDIVIPY